MTEAAPPTAEAEGGGPAGQRLWLDAVCVRAHVVDLSLLLVNSDRTSGRTEQPPEEPRHQTGNSYLLADKVSKYQ